MENAAIAGANTPKMPPLRDMSSIAAFCRFIGSKRCQAILMPLNWTFRYSGHRYIGPPTVFCFSLATARQSLPSQLLPLQLLLLLLCELCLRSHACPVASYDSSTYTAARAPPACCFLQQLRSSLLRYFSNYSSIHLYTKGSSFQDTLFVRQLQVAVSSTDSGKI